MFTSTAQQHASKCWEAPAQRSSVPRSLNLEVDRRLGALERFRRSKAAGDTLRMVPLHIQLANSTLRRVIKRLHFPLGFKSFWSATKINAGIETMHMIKKGQLGCHQGLVVSDAYRFYSLATR